DEVPFEVEYYESNEDAVGLVVKSFVRPFDLRRGPMLRAAHIRLGDEDHLLLFDIHHIINDGVSQNMLVSEFMHLYNGEVLEAPLLHYKDYAVWQQEEAQQQLAARDKLYWLNLYGETVTPLELPVDYERPSVRSQQGAVYRFELSELETTGLKQLSNRKGVTMYMVMLSIYGILLSKLGNQEDIVIGTPTSGRSHADLEEMLGMFVNTLALRVHVDSGTSFTEYLASLKERVLSSFDHQSYQYEDLIDALQLSRDTSRNPLFDVMFSYDHQEESTGLQLDGLKAVSFDQEITVAKFDLTWAVNQSQEKIFINVNYVGKLFSEATISRFTGYYKKIINEILSNPQTRISELNILPENEKKIILHDFNNTEIDFDSDESIVSLFTKQVERSKDEVAYIHADHELTFGELDRLSNKVANLLLKKGLTEEQLIPVCFDPGLEMMISILGILKARAAYVPINPEHPRGLKDYLLSDMSALFLLCDEKNKKDFEAQENVDLIVVDTELSNLKTSDKAVSLDISNDHAAYVIYTSGSTGRPKGVVVTHSSLINYVHNGRTDYLTPEGSGSATYLLLSYAFDASLTSIFIPLLSGRTTILASDNQTVLFDDPAFQSNAPYDFLKLTPSHLQILADYMEYSNEDFPTGRLVLGGEPLYLHQLDFLEKGIEIINEYGPTEATVGCSTYVHRIGDSTVVNKQLPIGKPLDNVQFYILDSNHHLLPLGATGELFIGGDCLAAKYLNNPGLTTEKFIPNPFSDSADSRLYRTGDLVKWLPDGNLAFKGRIDEQVKIRGVRVELGEIEHGLTAIPEIREAVVIKQSNGDHEYLIGYYVSQEPVLKEKIVDALADRLPV
ncbi:MAG: amino acid adenylation domain-containing protein, partial [Cyclobacteriaceae bacterium]